MAGVEVSGTSATADRALYLADDCWLRCKLSMKAGIVSSFGRAVTTVRLLRRHILHLRNNSPSASYPFAETINTKKSGSLVKNAKRCLMLR